ncbi:12909_t:CDS:2, partial [Racocetra fulgida]
MQFKGDNFVLIEKAGNVVGIAGGGKLAVSADGLKAVDFGAACVAACGGDLGTPDRCGDCGFGKGSRLI